MTSAPTDPRLARYAECFTALEWAVMMLDANWRLVWASDELRQFIRASREDDVGYGLHVAEAILRDPWLSGMAPASIAPLVGDIGPYVLHDLQSRGQSPEDALPPEMMSLVDGIEPEQPPDILRTSFLAVDPDDPDLPPYPVNVCCMLLRDENAAPLGWAAIMFMGVRPNLLALLARGDEQMYERMARLVEPRPRQAAVLFCDIHSSGKLSRQLPSANYFRLVRALWTGIDQKVADNSGIVGKHAGDGASAYFLVDDLGSASEAAVAAVRAAAEIHRLSEDIFSDMLGGDCPMRIGLHWGGSIYMGQLVPGSRLDVSALGDEVNEASRIQDAAGAGETIVSKQLIERLSPRDGGRVGIDLEKVSYRLLGDVAPHAPKVIRDAGMLPVTTLKSHSSLDGTDESNDRPHRQPSDDDSNAAAERSVMRRHPPEPRPNRFTAVAETKRWSAG